MFVKLMAVKILHAKMPPLIRLICELNVFSSFCKNLKCILELIFIVIVFQSRDGFGLSPPRRD